MLLVHLHYPNAETYVGGLFARRKQLFAASELFHSYLGCGLTPLLRHPLQIRLCGPSVPKGFRHRSQCRLSVGASSPFTSRACARRGCCRYCPDYSRHIVYCQHRAEGRALARAYQIADDRLVVRLADHNRLG